MRCDLHVHSRHSGRTTLPVLHHVARDSYSEPEQIYETARRRGMDLVVITDHDSIEGGLEIAHRPGVLLGEELSCRFPSGRSYHLGVLGLDERQHEGLQRRREDLEALLAYLGEQRLLAVLNHPFSPVIGPREPEDLMLGLEAISHVEVLNGMMPPPGNGAAAAAARALRRIPVGGSDAHTLTGVGCAWTEVPGARDAGEYLAGLRAGAGVVRGTSAGWGRLTAAIATTAVSTYREAARDARRDRAAALRFLALLLALPVMAAIPAATAIAHVRERALARAYARRFRERRLDSPPRVRE